jgi:hypothetical protein
MYLNISPNHVQECGSAWSDACLTRGCFRPITILNLVTTFTFQPLWTN